MVHREDELDPDAYHREYADSTGLHGTYMLCKILSFVAPSMAPCMAMAPASCLATKITRTRMLKIKGLGDREST